MRKKHSFKAWSKKNAGPIMCAFGIAEMIGGYFSMYRGTRKAAEILTAKWIEEHPGQVPPPDVFHEYTFKERFKATWKAYIATTAIGAVSTATIIAGQGTTEKRNAALTSMLKIANETNEAQRKATEEVVGKEKAEEIQKKVSENTMQSNEEAAETIRAKRIKIVDGLSSAYVYSSWKSLQKKINRINDELVTGIIDGCTYEEYLTELDFDRESDIPQIADALEWDAYHTIDVEPQARMDYQNGEPYIYLYHRVMPS